MSKSESGRDNQGSVIGGWVCLGLGAALMFWTLFSFFLYLPLFLAAFVLGIVAIAQKRLGHGIPILLLSVVTPLIVGSVLGAYRSYEEIEKAESNSNSQGSAEVSESSSMKAVKQEYINENTKLYDVEAKYTESRLKGTVPGVDFKVKNTGERTLDLVEVTVKFQNSKGEIIFEEEYTPVLVSKYNVTGDNKPLKPGYIWQQERGKFYIANSVPTEWKEGEVKASIKNIDFANKSNSEERSN